MTRKAKPPLSSSEHAAVAAALQAAWRIINVSERPCWLMRRLAEKLEIDVPLGTAPVHNLREWRTRAIGDSEIETALGHLETAEAIYIRRRPGTAGAIDAGNKLKASLIAMKGRLLCQLRDSLLEQQAAMAARAAARAAAATPRRPEPSKPVLVFDRDAVWRRHYAGELVVRVPIEPRWRITQRLLDLFEEYVGHPCGTVAELIAWINTKSPEFFRLAAKSRYGE
jgi:hypothetical protein